MNLDALEYFVAVVEEKSISKAAGRLHLTQSALSQTIRKLEEDFGHKLLSRSNKGVSLTAAGDIVLKYAGNVVKNMEKMRQELASYDANDKRISIVGTGSLAAYSLPCVIYKVKKKFPEFAYDLEVKKPEDVVFDIRNDMADIGFLEEVAKEDLEGLHLVRMGREKVVLIAKAGYPVADRMALKDLFKMELILCTMNKHSCQQLETILNQRNKNTGDLNIIFQADDLTSVKSSVMNGYGMAFVPYESVKRELYEKKVKVVEVEDVDLDYDIYMVSKKPKDLSPSAAKSLDYLIEIGRKSFC